MTQERKPNLPSKEEALARCEVGVNCQESGECFLATIQKGLATTAISTRTMDEILPDDALVEKNAILKDIANLSKLAQCGMTLAAADIQSETA